MTAQATFEIVAGLVRETLALAGDAPVRAEQLLFFDLGFTSMDLIDLLFRVEQRFGISIPEGTLYGLARAELDETAFAHEGVLSPVGRERLMALLHDSPPEIFPAEIHATTLPRYCTVGAICRLADHKLGEKG
jgi:acyl carrier protein